jgi:hypothetical protein
VTGPALWRTVEESSASAVSSAKANQFDDGRRRFLKWGAAALAMAGAGCQPPIEKILPYVGGAAGPLQGVPRFYATALSLGGSALGVLAESNMGRPTKIEANPAHPSSLGATDVFAQASVLQLWDPERSQSVRRGDQIATRESLVAEFTGKAAGLRRSGGAGLRILTRYIDSPTLREQLAGKTSRPRANAFLSGPRANCAKLSGNCGADRRHEGAVALVTSGAEALEASVCLAVKDGLAALNVPARSDETARLASDV